VSRGVGARQRRSAGTPPDAPGDPADGLRIRRGSIHDYDLLAGFHYRSGRPATFVRVLVARAEGEVAGVLVVSNPTLNGAWRRLAWPGRFSGPDKQLAAARLNADVRCISRVVVDPRFRGLGVGTRLVRSYLRRPMTVCTEAVAAMGAACPFFAAAGMRAYVLPPRAADLALLRAVRACGLRAEDLVDVERAARAAAVSAHLRRALEVWSRSGRGRSVDPGEGVRGLVRRAAVTALCRPVAYAWGGGISGAVSGGRAGDGTEEA
jgi:GNAT superfamily N-acetyltransferase